MKFHWRSLLRVSLVSALAIAPLLVLATAKGKLHPTPLQHSLSLSRTTLQELGTLYLGFAFVCFVLFLCIGALLLFLSAMIDRVPPPFPHPHKQPSENDGDWQK